jgi:hypothetical protein
MMAKIINIFRKIFINNDIHTNFLCVDKSG